MIIANTPSDMIERFIRSRIPSGGMKGDVNLDGKVDATDARLALRAAAKLDTLTGQAFTNADVDGSGIINAEDARKILRVAAKLESF